MVKKQYAMVRRMGRHFSKAGQDPFHTNYRGGTLESEVRNLPSTEREAPTIEVPKNWDAFPGVILSTKYCYGDTGNGVPETSYKQVFGGVAKTITQMGVKQGGYFANEQEAQIFQEELQVAMTNQLAMFNSPVLFNYRIFHEYGIKSGSKGGFRYEPKRDKIVPIPEGMAYAYPQGSACFILGVQDDMHSILNDAVVTPGMLFKYGSGAGMDLSQLRSSREQLSGKGIPSGPTSFMRPIDSIAAAIKSGGKTRRAALMVSLNASHPNIMDFIELKKRQEKIGRDLIAQGYDGSFGGEVYNQIHFQNMNTAVRIPDEFMAAVKNNGDWQTHAITTGEVIETFKARELIRKLAEATHYCGDPGVQFDTTINNWNSCESSGRINASNPCSEFMFLDDSACNLASINLLRFLRTDGAIDVPGLKYITRLFTIAQEIIVDGAGYPNARVAQNSHDFRPLGLGYANLGGLLMATGQAYSSDSGRKLAGSLTDLIASESMRTSADLAIPKGPFPRYDENKDSVMKVIEKHRNKHRELTAGNEDELSRAAEENWEYLQKTVPKTGIRNAQSTLLAPTGTIGPLMGCDTTGVEPDIALIKQKQMVDGTTVRLVNGSVGPGLTRLGYQAGEIEDIIKYLNKNETIEGAPHLKSEHLPVFDCALKLGKAQRTLHYKDHLKMMAAVQPFLSGAISKTINMPGEATVEDIVEVFGLAHEWGLKAVTIYRQGSKFTEVYRSNNSAGLEKKVECHKPIRKKLPNDRNAVIHKFDVNGHEGYLTIGLYADSGRPGEMFITMAKEGSTIGGTMDSFGTAISLALQYGVPLKEFEDKFINSRYEPSGFTKNKDIPIAKSIVDYIFRYMAITFPEPGEAEKTKTDVEKVAEALEDKPTERKAMVTNDKSGTPCACGGILEPISSCKSKCSGCGTIKDTGCVE
ncbi:MAG: vitamin B12-dependent ribonucleotide reductase [Nanoarchaeota archaeon]